MCQNGTGAYHGAGNKGGERQARFAMAYGRREIAPSDQIKALRHARDQYVQLADRIHNETDPALDDAQKQLREDNARRIAKAYDRSLSNNVARLSGMERTHKPTQFFGLWYRIGVLLILALACALPFAYQYRSSLNRFADVREIESLALNLMPARTAPPAEIKAPPAPVAQKSPPQETQTPQVTKLDAPAIAAPVPTPVPMSVPAPAKVAPPRAPAAKKPVVKPREAKREPAKAKPDAAKPVAQKPPEVAKASIPALTELPRAEPPRAEPPLSAAPAAPLPAPAAMPAPPAPPAPQVVAVIPPPALLPPQPIMETHTQPPYPPLSARAGETGTTKISVAISPQGQATDCRITQTSGADRLDRVACAHVTDRWRWKPTGRDSTMPVPRTTVTVVWNLRRPAPQR